MVAARALKLAAPLVSATRSVAVGGSIEDVLAIWFDKFPFPITRMCVSRQGGTPSDVEHWTFF
jgi:hypothetical protein